MASTQNLDRRIPFSKFEYVDVTFHATANTDTDIPHTLDPVDPEGVRFEVVEWELASAPATPPVAYKDSSATRKPWKSTHIYLRCTLAGATARLRLSLE